MTPIKLLAHDFDVVAGEHWQEELDAFLVSDNIVVRFEDDHELIVYKFPQSLAGRSSVDYWPGDGRVKKMTVFFDRVTRWQPFDLAKPFSEIIIELMEAK
ncbi:hypothetical protein RCG24_20530 [Neobacillus sp. OS1-32]|uniref:hypothetical protein n=1 Tax=Neobacillus sp. OS1-32 TaxID=3070682 RepID=UPI0027DF8090|nr:hypothetical protein [Neobacillus sp. OS1-32]WML30236.1 hypothetical protein RCG24_20530 [Neobacillus sp. OS1-32]